MLTNSKIKRFKYLLFHQIILSIIFISFGSCVKYYSKESNINLNKYKTIYVGWVDLHEENWGIHFYNSQEEWKTSINKLNSGFQVRLKNEFLTDKIIKSASYDKREPTEKNGLFIKFSNVKIDYNKYYLYMDLAFIDLETNSNLYEIPQCRFYGNAYGFENMLYYALEEAEKLIYREIYLKRYKAK